MSDIQFGSWKGPNERVCTRGSPHIVARNQVGSSSMTVQEELIDREGIAPHVLRLRRPARTAVAASPIVQGARAKPLFQRPFLSEAWHESKRRESSRSAEAECGSDRGDGWQVAGFRDFSGPYYKGGARTRPEIDQPNA